MSTDDLLIELIEVLDDELERISVLRFRLVVLGSLMAADQTPWLDRSVQELERASEQLRLVDLRRAATTAGLTDEYDLADDVRLGDIAQHVDQAWGEILRDRRLRLLEEVSGLQRLVETTTAAAGRRTALVQDALTFLHDRSAPATYGRRPAGTARLVEGAL